MLQFHDDVADAAVIGLPDENFGEVPFAWVVRKPKSTVTEVELLSYVNCEIQ